MIESVLLAYISECPAPVASISIGMLVFSCFSRWICEALSFNISACWTTSCNVVFEETFLKSNNK